MMELELKVNLRRLALVAISCSTWEQEAVQNKIKDILIIKDDFERLSKWTQLTKNLIKGIQSLSLPCHINGELSLALKSIGDRIYDWYIYLMKIKVFGEFTVEFYNNYFKKIYWTNVGTIDEVKTLKLFWLNERDRDIFKLFLAACAFCERELIDQLWEMLPENVRNDNYSRFFSDKTTYVLAYWIYLKRANLNNFLNDAKQYGLSEDTNAITISGNINYFLLKHATNTGNYLATQYFYKKWSRERFWKTSHCFNPELYIENRYVELCLIKLIAKSRENEPDCLWVINSFFQCSRMLTSVYPWQDILVPTFFKLGNILSDRSIQLLFTNVVKTLKSNFNYGVKLKNNPLQCYLTYLWRALRAELKLPVAREILRALFDLGDADNLKIIYNDEDLTDARAELLEIGFSKLISKFGDSECKNMIDSFVNDCLILVKWEGRVRERVSQIYEIIMNEHDVDKAREYLNFSCASEEEKRNILSNVNHIFLIHFLAVQNRVDTFDTYAEWVFPLENDRKEFRVSFKDKESTLNVIYKLWYGFKLEVEWLKAPSRMSNKFLEWIFSSDEREIFNFKENVILIDVRDNYWKKLGKMFIKSNNFEIVLKFLQWCHDFLLVEIDDIKKICFEIQLYEKCRKLVENDNLDRVKDLLKRCFKYPGERGKFLDDLFKKIKESRVKKKL